jgi:adenylate kinase family enzyme
MIRPLLDNTLVQNFLDGIFGKNAEITDSKIVSKIAEAELTIKSIDADSTTLTSAKYRDSNYSRERDRYELRKRIINELYSLERLKKDDDIKLGKGGALPHTNLQKNHEAYIITGLPASGKSSIAERVADEFGAVILDSDFAKRKLPEYRNFNIGATIIHRESNSIIFGDPYFNDTNFVTLLERLSVDGTNIVVPKIGDSVNDLLLLSKNLKEFGYEVHLMLVSLDRKKATQRAIKRFEQTKRYVPLSLIYDVYSNEPILTYYRLKTFHKEQFKSMGKVSNDVEFKTPPIFLDGDTINPAFLYKK